MIGWWGQFRLCEFEDACGTQRHYVRQIPNAVGRQDAPFNERGDESAVKALADLQIPHPFVVHRLWQEQQVDMRVLKALWTTEALRFGALGAARAREDSPPLRMDAPNATPLLLSVSPR